jgi:hypothetical protein
MAEPVAFWHYHHAQFLLEYASEIIKSRRAFIERDKDSIEVPLRLRLLKPVKGELPSALLAAHAEYQAADAKYQAAWAEWQAARAKWEAAGAKYQTAGAEWQAAFATEYQAAEAEYHAASAKYQAARAKYQAAYRDHLPVIEALHKIECPDCPWNGETIFTRKDKNGAWY